MKKIKAIMFLGLVVALLVIGFSPISEADWNFCDKPFWK